MNIPDAESNVPADRSNEEILVSLREIVVAVLQRPKTIAKIIGCGILLSVVLAFLLPNEYTSTAQLMPPDAAAFSSTSVLSALTSEGLLASAGLGSRILSQQTPAGTAIGILGSPAVQNAIINRFNLRSVYHLKYGADARKELARRSEFLEDRQSGIISVAVTDRDKHRAQEIAQDYIDQLNQITNDLSASSARRERLFLGKELVSVKKQLDDSMQRLAQFSSHNATLDIQKQGEATVESAGKLQAELISAESELYALKAAYTDDNVRVREARGRIAELQTQLQELTGASKETSGAGGKSGKNGEPMPSIRQLPLLGATYYDLYGQVTMQEATFEALNKQYELAKVEEAKELPPIRVLSAPDVPERKSSPHRLFLVLVGFLLSFIVSIAWVLVCRFWDRADNSHPIKAAVIEIMHRSRNTSSEELSVY